MPCNQVDPVRVGRDAGIPAAVFSGASGHVTRPVAHLARNRRVVQFECGAGSQDLARRQRTACVMLDLHSLIPVSGKPQIPWRKTRVAVVLLRAAGGAEQAHTIPEKLRLVEACGTDDTLLAVWMQQRHPLVLWVDDLAAPRVA